MSGGNILEMAQQKRREDLTAKMDEATAGQKASDVVIVCLERIQAIAEQPNAPEPFKKSVIAMMAGVIVELTK